MQSSDDQLMSPYSTPSFNSSFTATSDPQHAQAFHRYQHGDLAAPWYATSSPEQHVHQPSMGTSPMQQSFQVLGPYMMADPSMYGQSVLYDSGAVPNQQIQATLQPGMPDPRTPPAPSPPNNGVVPVYYQNSPAASYPIQHQVSGTVPLGYGSPGAMGHATDCSSLREGHRAPMPSLYKNSSSGSLDSTSSHRYSPAPIQTGPQTFKFVASEASSFTSDSGSQQRSQKAAKKRGTVTATRRPRKPPVEVVVESKLQATPELVGNVPRAGSPKRARREVGQRDSKATGERTPDSGRTVSPGTISKARIGERSRASTDASQRPNTADRVAGERGQDWGPAQLSQTENLQFLGQLPWAQELMEESQTLMKRVEEFCRLGTQLRNDIKRHERDMKGKLLEMPKATAGDDSRVNTPQASVNAGPQMRAQVDLRRGSIASSVTSSTTSTAISSRRNSPAESVYSTSQEAGWLYHPPKGL